MSTEDIFTPKSVIPPSPTAPLLSPGMGKRDSSGEASILTCHGGENTARMRPQEKICPFKYENEEKGNSELVTLLGTVGRKEGHLSLISISDVPVSSLKM